MAELHSEVGTRCFSCHFQLWTCCLHNPQQSGRMSAATEVEIASLELSVSALAGTLSDFI